MLFDLGLEDLLLNSLYGLPSSYFPGNLGRLGGAIIEQRKKEPE
jgi:hypothetical protein